MLDPKDFVSSAPPNMRTSEMDVLVTGHDGRLLDQFEGPPGFQLERYVMTIYPGDKIQFSTSPQEIKVDVLDSAGNVMKTYLGVYRTPRSAPKGILIVKDDSVSLKQVEELREQWHRTVEDTNLQDTLEECRQAVLEKCKDVVK